MAETQRKIRPAIIITIAAFAAAIAVALMAALSGFIPLGALPRTIRGLDGEVRIHAPAGTAQTRTKVEITRSNPLPETAYGLLPNAVAFDPPADIKIIKGGFEPNRVQVTMQLPDGLPEEAYANAFIGVYEEGLGQFIPLMDSRADPKRQTVTASAPHFSKYQSFVDTVKKGGERIISVGTDVATTVIPNLRFINFVPPLKQWVKDVQQEAFESLFALGPPLDCDDPSGSVKVKVKDVSRGQLLEACAEDYEDSSGRTYINIANHYAFPLLFDPPDGFTTGYRDFNFEEGTPAELISHIVWMNANKAVAPGPGLARFTLQPGSKLPANVEALLDWGPVAVDLAYALGSMVLPALKASGPEVKLALKEVGAVLGKQASTDAARGVEVLQALAKKYPDMAETFSGLFRILSAAQCVHSGLSEGGAYAQKLQSGNPLNQAMAHDKATAAMNIAYDCVKGEFAELAGSVGQFMDALANDLGLFPELVQTHIVSLGQKVGVDLSRVQLTVERTGPLKVSVDMVLYKDSIWRLSITNYTLAGQRLKLNFSFLNKSSSSQGLWCPRGQEHNGNLTFDDGTRVEPTETICDQRSGDEWDVGAGQTFKSFGVFRVDKSKFGQSFRVAWFGWGESDPIPLHG